VSHVSPCFTSLINWLLPILVLSAAPIVSFTKPNPSKQLADSLISFLLDMMDLYRAYDATQAYAVSKLANVLHTRELAARLQVRGIHHASMPLPLLLPCIFLGLSWSPFLQFGSLCRKRGPM